MGAQLGYGLALYAVGLATGVDLSFHLGQQSLVGCQTGLDLRQVVADLLTTVHAFAVVHVVQKSLLRVDGVETGVDVAHQKHQRVVEVRSLLIFGCQFLDTKRIFVNFLLVARAAGQQYGSDARK